MPVLPIGLLAVLVLLAGCASLSGPRGGLDADGQLKPCPSAPRCVSSQAEQPEKRVPPLTLRDAGEQTWDEVREAVGELPRTEIVASQARYLHAEVTSPMGVYIDDLELLREPGGRRVDVRSSARIGYYDFGVNRDRVEALRAWLRGRGLLAADN